MISELDETKRVHNNLNLTGTLLVVKTQTRNLEFNSEVPLLSSHLSIIIFSPVASTVLMATGYRAAGYDTMRLDWSVWLSCRSQA